MRVEAFYEALAKFNNFCEINYWEERNLIFT